jgi:hypothetical protein
MRAMGVSDSELATMREDIAKLEQLIRLEKRSPRMWQEPEPEELEPEELESPPPTISLRQQLEETQSNYNLMVEIGVPVSDLTGMREQIQDLKRTIQKVAGNTVVPLPQRSDGGVGAMTVERETRRLQNEEASEQLARQLADAEVCTASCKALQ